ncbi:RNA dependent RNA polymerase-domain-containing protein, partial [Sparassis latifolia]
AHSNYLQPYVERLATGVQWQIATAVSRDLDYDWLTIQILEDLRSLKTNTRAAPEAAKLFRQSPMKADDDRFEYAFSQENATKLPWEELDKEEEIWKKDHFGGIGCNQVHPDLAKTEPDWYGGKIHFTGALRIVRNALRIVLEDAHLGSSSRFMRRFGSWAFVRIHIHKDIYFKRNKLCEGDALFQYFARPFIINGSVFRAFFAKEQSVFLFQTNEAWDGTRVFVPPPRSRVQTAKASTGMSLLTFLNWHNQMEVNKKQTMVKWVARFALGLSNSMPGIRLEPHQVKYEPEIIYDAFEGPCKVPSEMEMTDGCGFISRRVLHDLQSRLQWQDEPTAIQCRVAGAKVCSILLYPDICPLDVQYLPADADKSLLTIDVLRSSRLSTPAHLSTETIINFAENNVPSKVFVTLMHDNMAEKVLGLMTWTGDNAMYKLWVNVCRGGSVIAQRLARMAVGTARARGYVFEDREQEDDEDGINGLDGMGIRSTAWWADPISGCPSTLEETVMVLLDSGFTPQNSAVLRAKLRVIVENTIKSFGSRYRIEVPMSCTAFIVPADPCGVLGPNEVHVKSSHHNLVDQQGNMTDLILGDVLVTRHPCKVRTDAQKVKAVFHEKLRGYVDVIIVNTKSHFYGDTDLKRHLASMTGGGDYDGDTMEVYWQPEIVNQFVNADPARYAREPPAVQGCLDKDDTTVAQFLTQTANATEMDLIIKLQSYLLGPLHGDTAAVGNYSTMWENASYKYGYGHEITVFLAYMFCAVLDGIKTGVSVKPEKYSSHLKQYKGHLPEWKETPEDRQRNERNGSNILYLRRNEHLPRFIMDELCRRFKEESQKKLKEIQGQFEQVGGTLTLDKDLATPWNDAVARARRQREQRNSPWFEEELEEIKRHVEETRESWKARVLVNKSSSNFTDMAIEDRQDILRRLSKEFASKPDPQQLESMSEQEMTRVRASYAYVHDFHAAGKVKWSRFPWDVAMRELCEIKAKATGHTKTTVEGFYMRFTMGRAFLNDL